MMQGDVGEMQSVRNSKLRTSIWMTRNWHGSLRGGQKSFCMNFILATNITLQHMCFAIAVRIYWRFVFVRIAICERGGFPLFTQKRR